MTEITIVLRGEAADRLQKLLDEKRYPGPEEAVADALEALDDATDPEVERWLREVVAERADAFEADPSRGVTGDEIRARLFGKG